MLAELTGEQLDEWKAYDRIDPIGQDREELRFATLWARILNLTMAILTPKGKEYEPVQPKEFMPSWDNVELEQAVPAAQTVDQMKKLFHMIAGERMPE